MDSLSKRLDRLGDAVAEVSDRTADGPALSAARRLLLAPSPPRSRRSVPRLAWAAGATAIAAALLVWFSVVRPQPTASFQVGEPPAEGTIGAWVAAGDDVAMPLRFSEGSRVTLEPGTRLRVADATPRGATLLIERGTVAASIVHQGEDTRWSLQAGPFELRVVGTEFAAGWDPMAETLTVTVQQGAIVANGPLLPRDRRVTAGERLEVSMREGRMALRKVPAGAEASGGGPALAAADPSTGDGDDDGEATAEAPVAAGPPGGGGHSAKAAAGSGGRGAGQAPNSDSWRKLAAERKYREAMTELDRLGFDQQVASASAGELKTLADVARLAGHPGKAHGALLELRRRYGAQGYSAFLLGKIAADQRGAAADAVRWFETYLSEQPNGPLAEQALGRILDIQRHGSPAAARQAAERYLARYPDGAYAALARSVLSP